MVCELIFFFGKNTIIQQKRPEPKKPHLNFFLNVLGQFWAFLLENFVLILFFTFAIINLNLIRRRKSFAVPYLGNYRRTRRRRIVTLTMVTFFSIYLYTGRTNKLWNKCSYRLAPSSWNISIRPTIVAKYDSS